MPSYAIERFVDATITSAGDAIAIRFQTDTEETVVLDLATSDLQAALLLLVGTVERAREKARQASRSAEAAGQAETVLPVSLIASAVRRDAGSGSLMAKLWLAPGRLPLSIQLSMPSARQLARKLVTATGAARLHSLTGDQT
jgi:hypothetical protein